MRARSLTRPVVGLYALKVVLLGAVFIVLLLSLASLQDDNGAARRTTTFLGDALMAENSVLGLQNGLRGYLLGGDPALLAPYQRAQAALPNELRTLNLAAQTSDQRARLRSIGIGVESYLTTVAAPVLASGGRLSGTPLRQVISRGDALVAALRGQFSALEANALAARSRRRRAVNSAVTRSIILASLGLALMLALDLGLIRFLVRGILVPVRTVARAAGQLSEGNLTVRVPDYTGLGEVEQLSNSFNRMASSTQSRTAELARARSRLAQAVSTAQEASAMKSNFLANMSHEVRTPLNGLIGMLTLLSETSLTDEQRSYVEIALSSSDALMSVVGDVLDIAKIEAGRLELESIDFDLYDAVEEVCDLMVAAARTKQLELQAFVHDDVPRIVRGDRTRVRQILQNLVSNAIKFTPRGEVSVEVTLADSDPQDIVVRFSVRDTGIGIDPNRLGELFQPFTQAELGTTRQFGGTGLGLAISRELAELMGGTIRAASVLGRGSTFTFELPFLPPQGELEAAPRPPALEGVRVLIVDDNATNRRVFQSYLGAWGARALATAGGHDAIAALRDAAGAGDPFRVALLDLNLDGESGLDLARDIAADPLIGATQLILLTSSGGEGAAEGVENVRRRLVKPVRRDRLLEAIGAAAGRRATDRAPEASEGGAATAPAVEAAAVIEAGEARAPAAVAGADPLAGPRRRRTDVPPSRILVAEDHDVNWTLVERLLALRGHDVDRAPDGERVLELLATGQRYDLILMDCQMPLRDGYETTRELRRREAAAGHGAHVPVVAMTANAMAGAREECLEAGMDDYVPKPINAEVLDGVLARWLQSEHLAASVEAPAEPRLRSTHLDPDRIGELRRLFPGEQLLEMIVQLADEVTKDLSDLVNAVGAEDQQQMAAAAHRIRNTGRLIGAQQLVEAAGEFDQPPRQGDPPYVFDRAVDERLLSRIQEHWESTQAALAELAGTLA